MMQSMDPSVANELNRAGGSVLCLGVPPRTEFGIDVNEWATADKFKGVKMIPPGLHYVFFTARAKQPGDFALRQGFFHDFKPQEVLVRRWNPTTEQLEALEDTDEAQRYAAGVRRHDFDGNLAPYPLDRYPLWKGLCAKISPKIASKFNATGLLLSGSSADEKAPLSSSMSSSPATTLPSSSAPSTQPPTQGATTGTQSMAPSDLEMTVTLSKYGFSSVPTVKTANLSPQQITAVHMDRTILLDKLLSESFNNDYNGLVGEFQLAFVIFLLGQREAGLEQWKHILHLLCNCEQALVSHVRLYVDFVAALRSQIKQLPSDFFVDPLSQGNFLEDCLRNFFDIERELRVTLKQSSPQLVQETAELRRAVRFQFGWDYDNSVLDKDNEFAPLVVAMDDMKVSSNNNNTGKTTTTGTAPDDSQPPRPYGVPAETWEAVLQAQRIVQHHENLAANQADSNGDDTTQSPKQPADTTQ